MCSMQASQMNEKIQRTEKTRLQKVSFKIDEIPPTALCFLLGFQHYLSISVSILSVPLLLAPAICMEHDDVGKSELTGTLFVTSGINTILQTLLGVRLPIIQCSAFAIMIPTLSYFSLPEWTCPNIIKEDRWDMSRPLNNSNHSFVIAGSEEHRNVWKIRLREIQGCIMLASLFEIFVGLSGLAGSMMRLIGPITICPTITLIGLALFKNAANMASKQWGIAILTVIILTFFSQCIGRFNVPCYLWSRKGCQKHKFPIFKMFPVILAILLSWLLCHIMTVADILPTNHTSYGYYARTDLRTHSIKAAPWFRFPYPGQWGLPTASVSGVLALLAGITSSMIESIGDYYSCAQLAGVSPPPVHAINRGIFVEGLGSVLAGILGTGNGTTSSSVNIGMLGITKVASRAVVVVTAFLLIIFGVFVKFGALFLSIPDPVIGGSFFILFGLIVAVGLSNLQHVDMNSGRNLFVIGTSLFAGMAIPQWFSHNKDFVNTGNVTLDSIIVVLFKTSMFVGGLIAFILDNTIPGSRKTRGMTYWDELRCLSFTDSSSSSSSQSSRLGSELSTTYEIKTITKRLVHFGILRHLPILPTYRQATIDADKSLCCVCCERDEDEVGDDDDDQPLATTISGI